MRTMFASMKCISNKPRRNTVRYLHKCFHLQFPADNFKENIGRNKC